MAWNHVKTLTAQAEPCARGLKTLGEGIVNLQSWLNLMARETGHGMRVTIEEEVNECCEKWRGKSVAVLDGGRDGIYVIDKAERPVFCLTCGRKL